MPSGTRLWSRRGQRRDRATDANVHRAGAPTIATQRDPLTGAHTRGALEAYLTQDVRNARRRGASPALLVIDLDHFKSVNDAFGHVRGDAVLCEFVSRTLGAMRGGDLLFRYGGDEFVLLMRKASIDQAWILAERLRDVTRSRPFEGDPPLTLSLSIGCASLDEDSEGVPPQQLFARADARLYQAKRLGRDRIVAGDTESLEIHGSPLLQSGTAGRLIERDGELATLQGFLDSLTLDGRGILRVKGPHGSGITRFLTEVQYAGRLHGYMVLPLVGSPALRQRVFGALAESLPEGLPSPTQGDERFLAKLSQRVRHDGAAGLLIVVDGIKDLDEDTTVLLRKMLFVPDMPRVALIVALPDRDGGSTAEAGAHLALPEIPLQPELNLRPFSPQGVHLWLRAMLQWEAPAAFTARLFEVTAGLPALLQTALTCLQREGVLRRALPETGWTLSPQFDGRPLRAWLDRARAQTMEPVSLLAAVAPLVGREGELAGVKRWVRQESLVTIVGPGGIGKTRLALQAAAEVSDRFPDGVHYVPLASVSAADFVPAALLQALGVAPAGALDPRSQVQQFLADKHLLLILDSFEHLSGDVTLLTDLLRAPRVHLLITSRERLPLTDVPVVNLRGLPPAQTVQGSAETALDGPDTPETAPAVQLFVQTARRARPSFSSSSDALAAIRRICILVEGLPLAIELAASWVSQFSCVEIAEALERNLDLLTRTPAARAAGKQSVEAVFAYFWDLLSHEEQARIGALAVFQGGFEGDPARFVAGASPFLLSALIDRSFLRRAAGGRYTMHELLRQYATSQLRSDPARFEEANRLHAEYYLALAECSDQETTGPARSSWFKRLDMEAGNVRAALTWSLENAPEMAVRMAAALGAYWLAGDKLREGLRWLQSALSPEREAVPRVAFTRARALNVLAQIEGVLGDYLAASTHFAAALAHSSDPFSGDPRVTAEILAGLCLVTSRLGDYARAQQLGEEGVATARETGSGPSLALALRSLGEVYAVVGSFPESISCLEESLSLYLRFEDLEGAAGCLKSLGNAAALLQDHATALQCYQRALELAGETGNKIAALSVLNDLGAVCFTQGQYLEAQQYYAQAHALGRDLGSPAGLIDSLNGLGKAACMRGDTAISWEHYQEAIRMARATRGVPSLLSTLAGVAALWGRTGSPVRGIEVLGLIGIHPARDTDVTRDLVQAQQALCVNFPDEEWEAALERGSLLDLEVVVMEILEQR